MAQPKLFSGDTLQFRQFVSVNKNYSMADLLPTLNQTADTLLPRFLGEELTAQLTDLAGQNLSEQDPDHALLRRALFLTRSVVAKLGFATHIIFAEVQIDNDGITVTGGDSRRAAFDYQTKELKRSLQELGWQSFDELLKLLAKNPDVFPDWETSPYYTDNQNGLFGSPAEFSKYYPIQDRWLTYWALTPFIQSVEDRFSAGPLGRIDALPGTVLEPARIKLKRSLLRALAYEIILLAVPALSIEVNGANVQVNYASQYGGKESYYTPPSRENLDWVKENLSAQAMLYWQTFEESIAPLEPATGTDPDEGLGFMDSDGPFVMI